MELLIRKEAKTTVVAVTGRLDAITTPEYEKRILELMQANTWPDKWTGEEETGDVLYDRVIEEGVVQPLLGLEQ